MYEAMAELSPLFCGLLRERNSTTSFTKLFLHCSAHKMVLRWGASTHQQNSPAVGRCGEAMKASTHHSCQGPRSGFRLSKTISNLGLGGKEKRTVTRNVSRGRGTPPVVRLSSNAVGYRIQNPLLARLVGPRRRAALPLEDLVPKDTSE